MKYESGELKAVAYKDGKKWAEEIVKTTGDPDRLEANAGQITNKSDGKDLAFITVRVNDNKGLTTPAADNIINFSIERPEEIIATDNGDPTDMSSFALPDRKAFNGLALVIIRSIDGGKGKITVRAESAGLEDVSVEIKAK